MGATMSKKERRTLARNKKEQADRVKKARRNGVRLDDLPKKKKQVARPKNGKK